MKQDIKNVLKVLLAICIGLWVCWLLSGCSPRIVEVEKPVIVEQTHTQTHTDIVRDTLVWRDSVYHFVKGDTVVIERYHNTERVERVGISDTLRDTIPRIVTVTETRIVEKNVLHWWQKALMFAGIVGIVGMLVVVGAKSLGK
jgi:hypothetical protein